MVDRAKLKKLAGVIVNYSLQLKKGENLVLKGHGFDTYPLVKEVFREAVRLGVHVDVRFGTNELGRIFLEEANEAQIKYVTNLDKEVAKSYDAMVQIVGYENRYEMNGVSGEKQAQRALAMKPLGDILSEKRWCLLYYPNAASAAVAQWSTEEWEDFVMDSCLLDWKKVEKLENRFIELLKKVSEVRVVGEGTDLKLSIKGQKWRACCGKRNLPDGEVFTAPVRTSVNGVIQYNTPSHYSGHDFNWIRLWIEKGKVVKEDSDNLAGLREILETDAGARYFGEFAFGLNKNIKKPTKMILFDEKMEKSLHMALGKCYKECPNGNDSAIHWDLIFRFKQGKAKIYFDSEEVFGGGKWKNKFDFLNKSF